MCGIAGILRLGESGEPPRLEALRAMAGALHHRGPDEFGVYRDARVGLAHARLSIVDLATGQQPLSNEDETLWTVFNGEIFNYVELRRVLVERGHRFRTQSDTEVIVHAYEEWGDEAFTRFNGQWAIALWDARRGRLVLARDRVGVRPLYMCEHRGLLYFASEVKAVFAADPSVERAFDPVGLDQCFTFWSPLAPRTAFAGVSELPAGMVRTLERGSVRDVRVYEQRYPTSRADHFRGSLDAAALEVRSSLERATSLRMLRADVPVGSYLSGGLDSSLIAALGARAKGEKFSTFSLRFADAEYDETQYQRLMAEALGSEHHELLVRREDIAAAFPAVVYHAERPLLRTAPAPLFLLSKLVRERGIKVVLTGEGADEMFAGYDLFREAKVRRFWAKQPSSELRPRLLERLYPYLARSPGAQPMMARQFFGRNLSAALEPGFAHEPRWFTTRTALRRFLAKPLRARFAAQDVIGELLGALPEGYGSWSPLARDQYLEIETLLGAYLLSAQGDRMLMANSVEGRFPFLDADVMSLAASLPAAYKLHVLDEKHVLKKASAGLIPEAIMRRSKQPYRAPDATAFVSGDGAEAPEWLAELMSPESLDEAGVFDPKPARELWRKCTARGAAQLSNSDNMALVGIISTQLVHAQLLRGAISVRPIELTTWMDRLEPERAARERPKVA